MKRSLIIGRTNVGKTLFCIRFCRYVGIKDVEWLIERADGRTEQTRMSLAEAERCLSDDSVHRTRALQSVVIHLPRGKGVRNLMLTDATGLASGIHPDASLRAAMAQTLRAMMESDVILHMVDAYELGLARVNGEGSSDNEPLGWNELDNQLASFGLTKTGYLILANKMDLPESKHGYRWLTERFTKHRVVPMSALHGSGFREVKQHVWRMA